VSAYGLEDEAHDQVAFFQTLQPLKVSYTEFPPYTYTDEYGVARGHFIEVIKEVLDGLTLPYQLISRPTAKTYHQLKVGEIDIWLGPRGVPTVAGHVWEVHLPDEYSINLCLWRMPETPEIQDLANLQDQSLAVITGFTYAGLIEKIAGQEGKVKLFQTSTHAAGFKMLISGRAQYLLDYERPVRSMMAEFTAVSLFCHSVQKTPVGFMVSRYISNNVALYETLNSAVQKRYTVKN
jgi:polar amino acid transport system substrate-binding protein